jgi:hypothetical protein
MKFLLPYRQRTEEILKRYCSANLKNKKKKIKVKYNKKILYDAYSMH